MNEANYITPNLDEGYSPEAIANMENALEEFIVSYYSVVSPINKNPTNSITKIVVLY